ncbi:MAG: hypothetical protein Q8M98_05030 [Candidatus Cloacimonadaceae bacterium]|nr:hypothetical protein [Candidatus Cloacimonadaceae bacterium]MDP3114125.1 hypothetical protein [Candidatus Cloacimonadaceae bacterium]
MFLIPLVLGALAIINPFISLILIMMFIGKTIEFSLISPIRAIGIFFVIPLIVIMLDSSMSTTVLVTDGVIGVGFTAVVYLIALRGLHNMCSAFSVAAVLIVVYGICRYYFFGDYLALANERAFSEVQSSLPQLFDGDIMQKSISLIKAIWPAVWIVSHLMALFIGFILFQRQMGLRFNWQELAFPKYYVLLIIAILPLYLVPGMQMLFINAMLALCFLPFIQGIGVMLHKLSKLIANKMLRAALLVLILLNTVSYLLITLLGFADLWLDLRKLHPGGNLT